MDKSNLTSCEYWHSDKVTNVYTNVHSENRFIMLKAGRVNCFFLLCNSFTRVTMQKATTTNI